VSRPPARFFALLTKNQLAEMIAPVYAKLSTIDPNEAYERLESSLKSVDLIEAVQIATWDALLGAKDGPPEQILDAVAKKLSKAKRFKPAVPARKDEGAWTALRSRLDLASGVATGEARDLLDTDQGRLLVDRGLELLGAHLAKELLR
jgi:hypothetical protein